jgi:hypothetical protein
MVLWMAYGSTLRRTMKNQIIADISIFKPGPNEAPTALSLHLLRPEGHHYVSTTIIVEPERMEEIVEFFERA